MITLIDKRLQLREILDFHPEVVPILEKWQLYGESNSWQPLEALLALAKENSDKIFSDIENQIYRVKMKALSWHRIYSVEMAVDFLKENYIHPVEAMIANLTFDLERENAINEAESKLNVRIAVASKGILKHIDTERKSLFPRLLEAEEKHRFGYFPGTGRCKRILKLLDQIRMAHLGLNSQLMDIHLKMDFRGEIPTPTQIFPKTANFYELEKLFREQMIFEEEVLHPLTKNILKTEGEYFLG